MPSLDDHFRALTKLGPPDEWPELDVLPPRPLREWPDLSPDAKRHRPGIRRLPRELHRAVVTALAFAVAAAGIGFAIWAFGRTPESPHPRPASTVENGKISYVVHGEGGNEIHVMDADGSNAAFLVEGRDPSWSPDGAQIAFRTGNPEKGGGLETRINLINADGTNLRTFSPDVLGEASGEAGPPVFSPDGTRLAFDTLGGIYVMNTDGTGIRRVSRYEGEFACYDLEPSWSPDGSKLVFVVICDGGNDGIWTVNTDGSNRRQLLSGDETSAYYLPVWSPNGTKIAFEAMHWKGSTIDTFSYLDSGIYVIDADGTGVRELLVADPTTECFGSPAWSPDGMKVAFSKCGEGAWWIGSVNADGTGVDLLTDGSGEVCCPAWQPVPVEEEIPRPSETQTPPSPTAAPPEGRLLLQATRRVEVLDRDGVRRVLGDDLFALDLSPDGSMALVSTWPEDHGDDAELMIVDLATGERSTIATTRGVAPPARWSPDGSMIAYRENNVLCVLDVAPAYPACMPELGRVIWFDWAPDSRRLVLGLSPPEPLTVFDTFSGEVTPLVRSDDDQVLRALDEVGFGQATRVQFEGPRWSSSGGYIATLAMVFETVGGTGGNMVLFFDAGGNLVGQGKPGGGEFWDARAWSPTSDIFAYGSGGGQNGTVEVRTLDPDTGEDVAVFWTEATGRGTLRDLAWSPSGRWMAVATEVATQNTYSWRISVVDAAFRETVGTIDFPDVGLVDWGP